jgi:hypothetical protein
MTNCCRFSVKPTNVNWVANYEKTRWFLVLHLTKPSGNELNKLLRVCNNEAQKFNHPPLYAASPEPNSTPRQIVRTERIKPSAVEIQDLSEAFHISIGWTLESPSEDLIELTKNVFQHGKFDAIKQIDILVKEIKLKLGNVVLSIPLSSRVSDSRPLFGG